MLYKKVHASFRFQFKLHSFRNFNMYTANHINFDSLMDLADSGTFAASFAIGNPFGIKYLGVRPFNLNIFGIIGCAKFFPVNWYKKY